MKVVSKMGYLGPTDMAVLKWIHISDIHVKSSADKLKDYNSDVVLQALWQDVSSRGQRIDPFLQDLDFAFITGDLAWSGDGDPPHDEYERVFTKIIAPLCHYTGLQLDQVFLVPGNHDVNRDLITSEAKKIERRLTSKDKVIQLFVDPDRYGAKRDLLFQRLRNYFEFIQRRFPHISIQTQTGTFALTTASARGTAVQIIGMNSAWVAHGDKIDKGKLIIGDPAVHNIPDRPSQEVLRIVLLHHPVKDPSAWFRPCDQQAIGELLKNADFVLYGHVHEPDVFSMMTINGSRICLVAGSIFENREWHSNSYNYVVFDTETRSGQVYMRRYVDNALPGPEYQRDLQTTGDSSNGVFPIVMMPAEINYYRGKQNLRFLVQAQSQALNRRPLLSEAYPERDSMEILFPDVYIDPLVRPFKHPLSEPVTLSTWLRDNLQPDRKVLVLGPAGTGKTTSLIGIQYQMAHQFMSGQNDMAPLFIEARAFDWNNPLSVDRAREVCLSTMDRLSDTVGPVDSFQESAILLLDALDEAFPSAYYESVKLNIAELVLPFPHIATSREDFFYRYLDNATFCSNYYEILQLEAWEMDREVKTFLGNYFRRISPQDYLAETQAVLTTLRRSLDEFNLPITPLSVTTFLFLWRYDQDELVKNPITTFAGLLGRFLRSWAEREVHAQACAFENADQLLWAYEEMAWILFRDRGSGPFELTHILRELSDPLRINVQMLSQDRGIRSILRLRRRRDAPKSEAVISFSHEAIFEYLVAKRLVKALSSADNDEDILDELVGYSINQLAREIINDTEVDERQRILQLLRRKYARAIDSRRNFLNWRWEFAINLLVGKRRRLAKQHRQIVRRNHLCYFIGRIESDINGQILAALFRDLMDGVLKDHVSVVTTVGSGILLSQHVALEKEYLRRLTGNDPLDVCNRSYHRVYYGDAEYVDPDTFSKDEYTPGIDDWAKTRNAILRRLKSDSRRATALRGLDLITFERFCETRGTPELGIEDERILRDCVRNIGYLPQEKKKLIQSTHSRVMELLEKQAR